MKIEDTEWKPPPRHKRKYPFKEVLENLKVGDIKRVFHEEATCKMKKSKSYCSLSKIICRLRREKEWKLEYYHEKEHVLVVRRIK